MMELRKQIDREEFDYLALMDALSGYASPRDKVTQLLETGVILRVKKGLYVFGDAYRRRPFSREVLANLIHGPSMVSLAYALAYHGLIPERVEAVTSVTTSRAKRFQTPVGLFTYSPTPTLALGGTLAGPPDKRFLLAVPERALADCLRSDRRLALRSRAAMERWLAEDLRMDMEEVIKLDAKLMAELGLALQSRKVALCASFLRTRQEKP
jgi:predicted transcriptional regulator of viral defense system